MKFAYCSLGNGHQKGKKEKRKRKRKIMKKGYPPERGQFIAFEDGCYSVSRVPYHHTPHFYDKGMAGRTVRLLLYFCVPRRRFPSKLDPVF